MRRDRHYGCWTPRRTTLVSISAARNDVCVALGGASGASEGGALLVELAVQILSATGISGELAARGPGDDAGGDHAHVGDPDLVVA